MADGMVNVIECPEDGKYIGFKSRSGECIVHLDAIIKGRGPSVSRIVTEWAEETLAHAPSVLKKSFKKGIRHA